MEDDVIDWAFYNAEEKRYLIAQCVREMGGPNTLQWDENRPRGIPSYRSIMRHLSASTWEEVLRMCGWTRPTHRLYQNRLCSQEEMVDVISDVMLEIKEADKRQALTVIPRGVIVQNGKVREVWEIR